MASRVICSAASLPWLMVSFLLLYQCSFVNTGLHPFCVRFDLRAEPQFSAERLDLGGARADLLRQHLFLCFIGVPSFFIKWFSLKQRDFKPLCEGVFRVLQV